MKVKALMYLFYNNSSYRPGDTAEVDKKEAARLIEIGAVSLVDQKEDGEEAVEAKEEENDKPDYNRLTVDQIRQMLDDEGINYPDEAKKSDLIELLN